MIREKKQKTFSSYNENYFTIELPNTSKPSVLVVIIDSIDTHNYLWTVKIVRVKVPDYGSKCIVIAIFLKQQPIQCYRVNTNDNSFLDK